jgi:lipopolysaccharide assembly outer membrane protein LptD (OstA)
MRILLILLFSFCYVFPLFAADIKAYGDKIFLDYKNQNFTLEGNAFISTATTQILAFYIKYQKKEDSLVANKKVTLFFPQDNVEIKGQALVKKRNIINISSVSGEKTLTIQKKGTPQERSITSKNVNINIKKDSTKVVSFTGSPVLEDKEVSISTESSIILHNKEKQVFFKGVTNILHKVNQTHIQSKDILYHEAKKEMIFNSPIDITDKDNNYLSANKGQYNLNTAILGLQQNVKFIGTNVNINSKAMDTQKEDKKLRYLFKGEPKISIKSMKGGADLIRYKKDEKILELMGNVKLHNTHNTLKISCNTMNVYEEKHKSYFYKDVIIMSGNKIIKGNLAIYDDMSDKFKVLGNVSLKDGENVYHSDEININNKDSSIEMVGHIKGESSLDSVKGLKFDDNAQ